MKWAFATDVGRVRPNNEDSLLVRPDLGLFAVADGMGGHRAGQVASKVALETLEKSMEGRLKEKEDPGSALVEAIKEANRSVYEMSSRHPDCAGMGTTLTAFLIDGACGYVAQVGDSRAYLLGPDGINLITEDHSFVWELVKRGGLTEEEAMCHPRRNVLTRALGIQPVLAVDLYRVDLLPGHILLLCTDGLTEYLRAGDILSVVKNAGEIEEAVQKLIGEALQAGGADNVSVILVKI